MDFGMDDKTAVVTGGGGRIGSEDCRVLADEGAEVVVLDVNESSAENVAEEINDGDSDGEAHAIECDLTDREDVSATVDALEEETGGIDILVNNAGMVDARDRVEEFDDEIWDRDIAVNLTGAYNITTEVFPHMKKREWGRILNMSSMAGWQGGFGQLSYAATKAALIGFGKTLALEGAQHGITSNAGATERGRRALRPHRGGHADAETRPRGGRGEYGRVPLLRTGELRHRPGHRCHRRYRPVLLLSPLAEFRLAEVPESRRCP